MRKFILAVALVVGIAAGFLATWYRIGSWLHLAVGMLSILFMVFGLHKSYERSTWAKIIIVLAGVLTFGHAMTALLIDSHSIELPQRLREIYWPTRRGMAWVIVGLLLALVLSGQLFGRKPQEIKK